MSTNCLAFCLSLAIGTVVLGVTSVKAMQMNRRGTVTGILYVPEDSSAVVNGEVVKVGDQIGGITIIAIEKFYVEFECEGSVWKQRIRGKPDWRWGEED